MLLKMGSLWRWWFFVCGMNICDSRRMYSSLCQCIFCLSCLFIAYHAVSVWMHLLRAAYRYQVLRPHVLEMFKGCRESCASCKLIYSCSDWRMLKGFLFFLYSFFFFFFLLYFHVCCVIDLLRTWFNALNVERIESVYSWTADNSIMISVPCLQMTKLFFFLNCLWFLWFCLFVGSFHIHSFLKAKTTILSKLKNRLEFPQNVILTGKDWYVSCF